MVFCYNTVWAKYLRFTESSVPTKQSNSQM